MSKEIQKIVQRSSVAEELAADQEAEIRAQAKGLVSRAPGHDISDLTHKVFSPNIPVHNPINPERDELVEQIEDNRFSSVNGEQIDPSRRDLLSAAGRTAIGQSNIALADQAQEFLRDQKPTEQPHS